MLPRGLCLLLKMATRKPPSQNEEEVTETGESFAMLLQIGSIWQTFFTEILPTLDCVLYRVQVGAKFSIIASLFNALPSLEQRQLEHSSNDLDFIPR